MKKTIQKTSSNNRHNITTATAFAVSAYAMVAIVSDIASNKVIPLGAFLADAGTIFIPFSFLLRDILHQQVGAKNIVRIVNAVAICNLAVAVLLAVVNVLPCDSAEFQNAWSIAMGSSWRIIVASFIAQWVSDLIDTAIFEAFTRKHGHSHKIWLRCLVSNIFSVSADSIIFSVLAFAGVMSMSEVANVIITTGSIKLAFSTATIPLAYIANARGE